jgi:membrane protein implicated in regulation of membrane protease activity
MPQNWPSWMLVILGGIMILIEILLGAATGLDFALVGVSLATGGAVGLFLDSTQAGLFAAGALAFLYLAFLRKAVRSTMRSPDLPSNVDALIGGKAVVTARIAPEQPGQVRAGDELWRAALSRTTQQAREPGDTVFVESVEGVTLIVR